MDFRKNTGFSLLEMSISMAILSIISLLGFIVLQSSTESAAIATGKNKVQSDLRDVMQLLTSEVREAYTRRTIDAMIAPDETEAIQVSEDGESITWQTPVPVDGPGMVTVSAPITVFFENEDENGNALLDDGEDTNQDGVLTRRLVRVQDGTETTLAAANNISAVQFALLPNSDTGNDMLTTLQISLESAIRYGGDDKLVRAALESRIDLKN
jgi:prepilin-type N-terminal cleavage/methylation domain-containing protein